MFNLPVVGLIDYISIKADVLFVWLVLCAKRELPFKGVQFGCWQTRADGFGCRVRAVVYEGVLNQQGFLPLLLAYGYALHVLDDAES